MFFWYILSWTFILFFVLSVFLLRGICAFIDQFPYFFVCSIFCVSWEFYVLYRLFVNPSLLLFLFLLAYLFIFESFFDCFFVVSWELSSLLFLLIRFCCVSVMSHLSWGQGYRFSECFGCWFTCLYLKSWLVNIPNYSMMFIHVLTPGLGGQ